MKRVTIALAVIAVMICCSTSAQVKMPAPSPVQTIQQDFGMGSIQVIYSRPGAKGRRVFGDLVQNGKLWRTGANAATRISFSDPVEIGGKKIDSGTYVLYSIPGEESWDIILNKGLNNWGIDGYREAQDVFRFKVLPVRTKNMVETFTMQFINIKPDSCELEISWEKTLVRIPITADIREKIKAQIEAGMLTDKKPYWEAAQFYNEYEKNYSKALEYADKALQGNEKAFWILLYKARIQQSLGDIPGAITSSKASMALAKEAGYDDYVKMNTELQKELRQ